MTRDDILRWAREAGFDTINYKSDQWDVICSDGIITNEMQAFAVLVAAAEREACCSLVYSHCDSDNVAQRTVDAIRARGEA